MSDEVILPAIDSTVLPSLCSITNALQVPRDVLAGDEEIQYAWRDLPRELRKIPIDLRDESLVKMCVAISSGLFDGAINYVWNSSIRNLRKKVKDFGLNVVAQMLEKDFTEQKLDDLRDSELLSLCLKLNLISEEGFYFLDQCRDIRNNFSAAHPSIGPLDDRELIVFISRCAKYALSTTTNLTGVDINNFIKSVKEDKFNDTQIDIWYERLNNTHDAQRAALFEMLYGIYCDPSSNEEARINALLLNKKFVDSFTPDVKSSLLNRHCEYKAKGDIKRYKASQIFFEKMGLLNLLDKMEIHAIFSEACKHLMNVHLEYNNFYNEPPFAERLLQLSQEYEIPLATKNEYVITVLSCYIGNQYGISNAGLPYYENMIRNFSPKEIEIMINSINTNTILSNRVKEFSNCRRRYYNSFKLINESSVPSTSKRNYDILIGKAN